MKPIEYTVKVYADGTKRWCINGQLHREDGPAFEYANGDKRWYINNQLHREDGPAIEYADGDKFWYVNGESLTQEEHAQRTSSCEGETVTVRGVEYTLTRKVES